MASLGIEVRRRLPGRRVALIRWVDSRVGGFRFPFGAQKLGGEFPPGVVRRWRQLCGVRITEKGVRFYSERHWDAFLQGYTEGDIETREHVRPWICVVSSSIGVDLVFSDLPLCQKYPQVRI